MQYEIHLIGHGSQILAIDFSSHLIGTPIHPYSLCSNSPKIHLPIRWESTVFMNTTQPPNMKVKLQLEMVEPDIMSYPSTFTPPPYWKGFSNKVGGEVGGPLRFSYDVGDPPTFTPSLLIDYVQ